MLKYLVSLMGCFLPFVSAAETRVIRLDSLQGLRGVNLQMDVADYAGRKAVHVLAPAQLHGPAIVLLPGTFENGTIEIDVAGRPGPGADDTARGFIGAAFRVADERHFDCFYLRPTNGRADDQLRRNHSVQYVAEPEFPWFRLRKENPGEYESYADLQPGVWTAMRIVVAGRRAELYVNGSDQPCLIVRELKGAAGTGALALWTGDGTEGYFSNLRVIAP